MFSLSALPLREAIVRASAQGTRFWLRGAEVATDAAFAPAHLTALWRQATDERPYLDLLSQLEVTVDLISTRRQLHDAIRMLEQDKREHGALVGIDLETASAINNRPHALLEFTKRGELKARQPDPPNPDLLDTHRGRIATVQLYGGGSSVFIFRGEALALLVHSHWLRRQQLVAHNAGFEVKFLLAANAASPPGQARRAMGAIHCSEQSSALLLGPSYAPAPRKLSSVAKHLFGLEVAKDYATSDWSAPTLSPGQLAYAGADAVLTWRIHRTLASQLAASSLHRAYDLQRGCIPAIAVMEHRGLGFDHLRHAGQVTEWTQERDAAVAVFQQTAGRSPPRKGRELAAWIKDVLPSGMRWPRTGSGELSTAGKHLKRLAMVPEAHPLLQVLCMDKLLSAFGESLATLVNPMTARLHASYRIAGTKTGRFTCNSPNLQQLPAAKAPAFKQAIVPAPGYRLIGADWNQVEMRAAGFLADEPALYDLFAQGLDLHQETAATIARIPYADVTKPLRQRAKCISFGTTFGMQAASLVEYAYDNFDVVMTVLEAQRALDSIAARFPRLHRWKRAHFMLCRRRGYVAIGCGRIVKAEWEANGNLWFALCCNLPIQGICADAMMRAIQLVHKRLRAARLDAFLVATVHDELLVEARESDAEVAAAILQTAMLDAFAMTFPGFPIVKLVDVHIGGDWAAVKE